MYQDLFWHIGACSKTEADCPFWTYSSKALLLSVFPTSPVFGGTCCSSHLFCFGSEILLLAKDGLPSPKISLNFTPSCFHNPSFRILFFSFLKRGTSLSLTLSSEHLSKALSSHVLSPWLASWHQHPSVHQRLTCGLNFPFLTCDYNFPSNTVHPTLK